MRAPIKRVALFAPVVTAGFLEQVSRVETWRKIEVSLVTRDRKRIRQKENSTREGTKSGKGLVSMKNWKAALDREYAKRDMRSIKKSGQGPMSVAGLEGMFWEGTGGLQGGEWHGQIYSLK